MKTKTILRLVKNGEIWCDIETKKGKLVTSGKLGKHTFDNISDLFYHLSGKGIKIDDFLYL